MATDSENYIKSNQTFLRMFNRKKVLEILRSKGSMSRVELSKVSKLDKKTITNIVNDLFEKNQIYLKSVEKQGNGRPKEILALKGDFCRCLGLDIGGTHISGVILDFTGKKLAEGNIELNRKLDQNMLINMCDLLINQILKMAEMSIEEISEIGISFPGSTDKATGKVVLAENMPEWNGYSVSEVFEKKYEKKVYIEDCSRLMAMAEMNYGKGKNCDNFIVFDLGLGIGCGIVIGRELFYGAKGKAGEVGHTIVKIDGPLCTCGRNGCIESLASGWAISKQAFDMIRKNEDSILRKIVNVREDLSTRDIILAAQMGDDECIQLLRGAGGYIGIGIANAVSLFNPEKIIIGGRLIKNNHILIDELVKTVKSKTLEGLYDEDLITISDLGDYASAIGAATICLNNYYV